MHCSNLTFVFCNRKPDCRGSVENVTCVLSGLLSDNANQGTDYFTSSTKMIDWLSVFLYLIDTFSIPYYVSFVNAPHTIKHIFAAYTPPASAYIFALSSLWGGTDEQEHETNSSQLCFLTLQGRIAAGHCAGCRTSRNGKSASNESGLQVYAVICRTVRNNKPTARERSR